MPHTEHAGGTIDVPLSTIERAVLRHALDTHQPKLESNLKTSRELGAPNEIAKLHLNIINGDDGWGESLRSKLLGNISLVEGSGDGKKESDQLDITDEEQKAKDEERAKFKAEREDFAGLLIALPPFMAASVEYVERTVLAWSPEQFAEAKQWAWETEANANAPKPAHIDALCDRIEEAQMSTDEVAFWLDFGPAGVSQGVYENSEVAFFYAEIPNTGAQSTMFAPNFETLYEAQASAARINRNEWKLQNPDATSTPWDDEVAKQPVVVAGD